MKNIFIAFFITIVILFSSTFALSGGKITPLSKKAADLKRGMNKSTIINLLGQPTWAVLPGDEGDFAIPDPNIKLILQWKNPGCTPVVVHFDSNFKAIGWDEGRSYCAKDANIFEPPSSFTCNKKGRIKYCK